MSLPGKARVAGPTLGLALRMLAAAAAPAAAAAAHTAAATAFPATVLATAALGPW